MAAIISNKEWLGWEGSVIIDKFGKNNSLVGRNDYYKPVVVKNAKLKIGDVVKARVIRIMQNYLEAMLV